MTDEERLSDLAAATHFVLLDFDGPVCDLFANLPADAVAASVLDELEGMLGGPVDEDLADIDDPLDLLDGVSEIYPQLLPAVDSAVREAEADAGALAPLTAGAVDFLQVCVDSGRRLAIVSNNGAEAVRTVLDLHDLSERVLHVQGRDPDPRLMKPDPTPLLQAMRALGADPTRTTMIGDSSSDMLAARAAGIEAIALLEAAPPPATPDAGQAWVAGMDQLAELFRRSEPRTPRR
ncbi:HAD family hydrolase [Kineosporia babensis]|uniref:HAD-IA family hydrolase n=1 Tax=Kineosporia babensis TaxID=499548 RepID=A0A9X1SV85_9ACTN|nr:HAD-IA family hydrolase [Kineosporia babensis]MCD5313346.1 HAD-IA family hydrolase [Kineosporia babensis]